MATLFVIEAFGIHAPPVLIDSEREGERRQQAPAALLFDTFEARAEMMEWSSTSRSSRGRNLWNLYEGSLVDDPAVIGWVYGELADPPYLESAPVPEVMPKEGSLGGPVGLSRPPSGLNASAGLSVALPPLVQCFDDALRRIGAVDVSGMQLTCYQATGEPVVGPASHLISSVGWFDASRQARADAVIAFDEGFLGGNSPDALADQVRGTRTGGFDFGQTVVVPYRHKVRVPVSTPLPEVSVEPAGSGLAVSLPEWSGSAIGWTLATVINVARAIAPDAASFAVRIARVG